MSAPYMDPLSGNQRARAEIARGLAKSAAGDSLGTRALAVLARLVADVSPHVRVNAVRSLGTYGPIAKASLIYATRDQRCERADRRGAELRNGTVRQCNGAAGAVGG